jgi:hypothetical protein
LRDHSSRTAAKSDYDWYADETFFPNQADFYAFAIGLESEDGFQSGIDEIGRPDLLASFVKNRMQLQPNKLQRGKEDFIFIARQPQQYFVCDTVPVAVYLGDLGYRNRGFLRHRRLLCAA